MHGRGVFYGGDMLLKNIADLWIIRKTFDNKSDRMLAAASLLQCASVCLAHLRIDACAGIYGDIIKIFANRLSRDVTFSDIRDYYEFLYGTVRRSLSGDHNAEYHYKVDYSLYNHPYDTMHNITNWEYADYDPVEYFKCLQHAKIYRASDLTNEWGSKARIEAIKNSAFYKQAILCTEVDADDELPYTDIVFCVLMDMICLGMYRHIDNLFSEKRKRNKNVCKAWILNSFICDQMHKHFSVGTNGGYVKLKESKTLPIWVDIPDYVNNELYEMNRWDDSYENFPNTFIYVNQSKIDMQHATRCQQLDCEYGWYYNYNHQHDLIWHCAGCGLSDRLEYEIVYGKKKSRKVIRENISSDERTNVYNRDGLECQQCGIICKPSERELGHILSLHDAESLNLTNWKHLNSAHNLLATCMSCNSSQGRNSMSPKFYQDWIKAKMHRPLVGIERELYGYLLDAMTLR